MLRSNSAMFAICEVSKERQRAAGGDRKSEEYKKSVPADLPEAVDKPTRKPKTERKKNESAEKAAVADQVVANLPQAGDEPRGYRNCGMLICQWPTRAGVNRQLCGRCVRPHSRAHARAG